MAKIIDISHHQVPSKIDYNKLAKEVDFVIIRTQYGSRTLDRHYKTHHAEFKKRGVPTAAYAWVRGTSIADMEVEATDFWNRTKGLNPTFWFLDVEEKSMGDMRAGVSAYVKKLRALGAKKVGIYIAHHLFKSFNLNLSEVDAVWIPHYGVNNGQINSKPSFPCDIHQYTSVGRLNGYSGDLDINRIISNKKLEYFTGKVQSVPKPKPTPKPQVAAKQETNDDYLHIVKSGDTLSGIAAKYKVSVNYLVKLNNIDNRHLIYPGQRIMLKGKVSQQATQKPKYHDVVEGDSVSELAQKYGSTIKQIKSWNKLDSRYTIYAGKTIRVK